jgi:hypothetical protein
MLRSPFYHGLLAALMLAAPPTALAGGAWTPPAPKTGAFGVPPGDYWGHFQCTNGERTMVAAGGVMDRQTGLSLPQCLERCSRASGCVGISYVAYVDEATGRDLNTQCTLLSSYVGRTDYAREHSGTVIKATFVCFTDRYRRDAPWNDADLLAVPDRYRSQFRPDVAPAYPGAGTTPRNGKYP